MAWCCSPIPAHFARWTCWDTTSSHRCRGKEAEPISLPKILELDQAARQPLAGTYASGPVTLLIIKNTDAGLTVKLPGQAPARLLPIGNDKFICRAFDSSFDFERNEAGEVTGVKFELLGQKGDAKKKVRTN